MCTYGAPIHRMFTHYLLSNLIQKYIDDPEHFALLYRFVTLSCY